MKLKQIFIVLVSIITMQCIAQQYNPVANPKAVINAGNARFTVLTERLIRLEYSPDSVFNDQATITFINRNLPVPAFEYKTGDGTLTIKTSYLLLTYTLNSGSFNKSNLQISYTDQQHSFTWHPGQRNKHNLKGTTRTLDGTLGQYSFQTMKKINTGEGILSRDGWILVDDSEKPVFDNSEWPWVQNSNTAGNTDWYLFGYGHNYKAALYDFTSVSGKMSLPPKYAFGVWYSKYSKYSEQDLKDIVAGYEKNNIPLDVLVIDMDWHMTKTSDPEVFARFKPEPDAWTGFTWSKKYFPDYAGFLKWTNDKNIKTCLNLHPASGVQAHEAVYNAFARAMNHDTTGYKPIPFDITNKRFAQNYFDLLLHPYEKAGIDFWWLDWQQYNHTALKGVNPTFYLNYVHFSDMQRQGKRPLIFHRYGGLGNQRYQIGFSGDVIINWKSLSYQPWFTATAANVGFGFWSHDIGGHMSAINEKLKLDPELFTRWVQWGALSPIFRTHATADPEIERRIWQYPAPYFSAMKSAIQLRYSLLPYIYTYSRMAYDSGISLIRPMYYQHPEIEDAYKCPQQYYFGENMIVAPICKPMTSKQTAEQTIWLPDGQWYDYRNNNMIAGNQKITQSYALNEIPVFVKQGSIIPQQPARLHADEPLDTIILLVYTGANGSFNLYEDDGISDAYRNGSYAFSKISFTQNNDGMRLSIKPDNKEFIGQIRERVWKIEIINCSKPGKVYINKQATTMFSYNSDKKTIGISLNKMPVEEKVDITIE